MTTTKISHFSTYDVLILADGLFPQKEEIQKLIIESSVVVCCDGAAQKLLAFGRMPDYVVGDLDSVTPELKKQYPERMVHRPDQNSNDLTKSVEFCISKGLRNIVIVGATGLREDHTLANISLLHHYTPLADNVVMVSDFGIFTPISNSTVFLSYKGQQVSIFSLSTDCAISTVGLKYLIENRSLNSWWEGTLNESVGEDFAIVLHTPGRLIIYQVY